MISCEATQHYTSLLYRKSSQDIVYQRLGARERQQSISYPNDNLKLIESRAANTLVSPYGAIRQLLLHSTDGKPMYAQLNSMRSSRDTCAEVSWKILGPVTGRQYSHPVFRIANGRLAEGPDRTRGSRRVQIKPSITKIGKASTRLSSRDTLHLTGERTVH